MNYKDVKLKSYSRAIILALTRTYGEDKVVLEQLGDVRQGLPVEAIKEYFKRLKERK